MTDRPIRSFLAPVPGARLAIVIALGLAPAAATAQGFGPSPGPAAKPSPAPKTDMPMPAPIPGPAATGTPTAPAAPAAPASPGEPKSDKPQLVNDLQPAFDAIKAKDWTAAEKFLAPKALARDPRAQFLLGAEIYGNRDSKLYDLKKAMPLIKDSAERGFARSMLFYGIAHADGAGTPKDMIEAYKWTALASRRRVPEAGPFLAAMAKDMTPDQIERAKIAADKFAPRR